jgi:uncharacterized phiE125 gp8 family phage protein
MPFFFSDRNSLEVVTPPATEPVTLTQAKAALRVDLSDDDTYITSLITSAREQVEIDTGRALITTAFKYRIDRFYDEIYLPKPKLISVSGIQYYDVNGTLQTLSSTYYQADAYSFPGVIYPGVATTYPQTQSGKVNAVIISYTGGYGDDATDVPQSLRDAILMLIQERYNKRDNYESNGMVTSYSSEYGRIVRRYALSMH